MIERNDVMMVDRSNPRGVATHCPYCGFQCGVSLIQADRRIAVAPRPDFPVNRGALCIKGWTAAEEPDEEYPLYLTTGRVLAHYQTGTQTRRVGRLSEVTPEPVADVHPSVARHYGLTDGDTVVLTTRRGSARFRVKATPTIRADTIFIPFHWGGEQAANLLTNPALDPVSRMPEFKVCAVRIEAPSTEGSDL